MSGSLFNAEVAHRDSPRPSSVDSNQSTHSSLNLSIHGQGKGDSGICVGEELRIAVSIALERFRLSEEQKELEFPSSLTSTERAYIHRLCQSLGLKSKSKGKGAGRFLVVTKKTGIQTVQAAAVFNIAKSSRNQIRTLLQRFPVTTKERQELQPRTERGQYTNGFAKDFNRGATTGRLGVPQVPPPPGESDLTSFRQSLPVYLMKDMIIRAINENKVVLVAGETGSGKTTQGFTKDFANLLHKWSFAKKVNGWRKFIEYSDSRHHWMPMFCRFPSFLPVLDHFCESCKSSFQSFFHWHPWDEIHERDRFCDFLLIVIREMLVKHKNLKLVLMSAALNIQLFSNYFSGCPVINANIRGYLIHSNPSPMS
ncbi:hypothetical protein LSH36_375g06066 [Paralvinella palmiformis]|uniref:R3H domain-containing protein n=1 Tax=Paralvinella palmiformis TaxID=53620 RepID=A0AAD9JDY6_9ANNE|nr:hypothetical protein LSH36_375g06066 [Paralvinella palmiformis]